MKYIKDSHPIDFSRHAKKRLNERTKKHNNNNFDKISSKKMENTIIGYLKNYNQYIYPARKFIINNIKFVAVDNGLRRKVITVAIKDK